MPQSHFPSPPHPCLSNKRSLATRDPRGRAPLTMGRLENVNIISLSRFFFFVIFFSPLFFHFSLKKREEKHLLKRKIGGKVLTRFCDFAVCFSQVAVSSVGVALLFCFFSYIYIFLIIFFFFFWFRRVLARYPHPTLLLHSIPALRYWNSPQSAAAAAAAARPAPCPRPRGSRPPAPRPRRPRWPQAPP